LRTAQLGLIRSLRAGHVKVTLSAGTFVLPEDPAFWAAFVLLGEPD
jgi:CHAT domain-containing protein